MGRPAIPMIGRTFGRLTVLRSAGQDTNAEYWYDCRCVCGDFTKVRGSQIRSGHVKSCGCLKREKVARIARVVKFQRDKTLTDVMLVKRLNGLHAADDAAADVVRALAQGEVIRANIRKPRNLQFHRKFFALLQLVYESTELWPSVDELLIDLKFRLGHVDAVQLSSGEVVKLPKSISFAKMDDVEFSQFFDRSMRVLCEMAGGIEEDGLREAVLQELAA